MPFKIRRMMSGVYSRMTQKYGKSPRCIRCGKRIRPDMEYYSSTSGKLATVYRIYCPTCFGTIYYDVDLRETSSKSVGGVHRLALSEGQKENTIRGIEI